MKLEQLKEILRAASEITKESEFYVIGSSAILHIFESPEHNYLSRSNEADLLVLSGDPAMADQLSIMIGELSPFHDNHDVYAEGATFDTPVYAPEGWRDRAVPVKYEDIGVTAHFMEIHDLALSKIGAGRHKDGEFCAALAETGYLNREVLIGRLPLIDCTVEQRRIMLDSIERHFKRR